MLDCYDLRMLNVGYDCKGSDWNWKNVCSPFARIYLVVKGNAEILFENFTLNLSAGNLYLIPPFMKHTYVGNKDFKLYYLHLYEYSERSSMMFEEVNFSVEKVATEADYAIFNTLHTVFPDTQLTESDPEKYDTDSELNIYCSRFINRPPCERMLLKGAMIVLLSRFIKTNTTTTNTDSGKLAEVREYINSHLSDDISVTTLANMACMSKSHFIRKFKATYSLSPKQFILHRRIERAELMLLLKNSSVKSISLSSGFEDISLFTKTFKRITGMTPKEYRWSNTFNLK